MKLDHTKPISDEISAYLKEYTDELDIAKACEVHNVGFHTLRRLRLGGTLVSNSKNENAIIELMKLAVKNAEESITKARKIKKHIKQILDTI